MKIKYIKNPQLYKVGDESIEKVAKKLGVSLLDLKRFNNIDSVHNGTLLAIPQESYKKKYYVVRPADTLEKISNKLGISRQVLEQKNRISKVFIGQILFY